MMVRHDRRGEISVQLELATGSRLNDDRSASYFVSSQGDDAGLMRFASGVLSGRFLCRAVATYCEQHHEQAAGLCEA
jgi:hypothetical protein